MRIVVAFSIVFGGGAYDCVRGWSMIYTRTAFGLESLFSLRPAWRPSDDALRAWI